MARPVKKPATKKSSDKRTLIAPNGDKRYIKRNEKGQIKESDDVGKSLSQDRKRKAKTKVKPGYGDQGDHGDQSRRKAPAKKPAAKKASIKKSAPKKSVARKTTTKAFAPKKSATGKSAPRKFAFRKSAPKKASSKKAGTKK